MHNNSIIANEWSIIEKEFHPDRVMASESLFSIGNGAMGQRANFEETYTGNSLQGSYIGGIYYPDKTRVGWWKNGYPEYFAKVLNAPNWIGIDILINGQVLDLNTCKVTAFYQELNMKEGWLKRSLTATFSNNNCVAVESLRFLSLSYKEAGAIQYTLTPLNFSGDIEMIPYIDAGIVNEDANYDEFFWKILTIENDEDGAYILSKTLKTNFYVCTGMKNRICLNGHLIHPEKQEVSKEKRTYHRYCIKVKKNDRLTLYKFGGYTQSMNHPKEALLTASKEMLGKVTDMGFDKLLELQKADWKKIWKTSDIVIKGDVKAQQAIRFNIFQLNQTYSGEDARLNIGPKGFTGEKYGGSTYWDTEGFCIPFYMSTRGKKVAKNLLLYRYHQLDKAIENAEKLGFYHGAALYPMVTMNGEECHNEWEITFEEIHRNGAMVYAIYNYVNYTGDYEYITQYGMEVIIAIARFWEQRATFSEPKKQYVILGVTGPNEYENNVNNNWYTNYIACWCLRYAVENLEKIASEFSSEYERILGITKLQTTEIENWKKVADAMYFPYDKEREIFLQQDGFLDKEILPAEEIPPSQRPINQKWSWDRILRSCFIKQADVLQGLYFFENQFSKSSLEKNFNFYEPLSVHESSLSPCVHSILASKLNKIDKAYEMYLRTARLDLDDYNKEVHEGCHITSMAGTWLAIVQGFGGMRVWEDGKLTFYPQIPKEWDSYSFTIKYRGATLEVYKSHTETRYRNVSETPVSITQDTKEIYVAPGSLVKLTSD